MKNSARLLIAVIIAALLGTMVVVVTSNIMSPQTAKALCDSASLRTFAAKGENDDKVKAAYLLQEADVCDLANDPKAAALKAATEANAKKAADEKAAADAATAKKKASDAKAKADPNNPDNWPRYERELISTRPTAEKMSANSFGPTYALHPDFRGTQLDKLSNKQFVEELKYRMQMSPVLTAATGAALDLWPENTVNDRIHSFLSDKNEWKKAVAKISKRLDQELKAGAHVATLPAGTYSATYSVTDKDRVPHFAVDDKVSRPDSFKTFRLSNGVDLRMICGGQQYTKHHKSAPRMPKPSPGMDRDNEGNPVVLVDVCRKVNGMWKKVYNVTKRSGDRPLNSSKCMPRTPPTTSTPSTPPTKPPKSCPPGTFWSDKYKECLKNKENETPPAPPTNRPIPTGSPTRSPEVTAPPKPTKPATTATPTVTAPGATATPSPSTSIPTVEPTATATGDCDPDSNDC
jgi:hypothetical protein